jgi:hypothetical protein
MKNKLYCLFILVTALFWPASIYSQGYFSVHLGPAIPVGDFAEDNLNEDDAGGAGVGLNIGGRFSYPVTDIGLSLFVGTDLYFNGLQREVKDDIEDRYDNWGIDVDIRYSKYINMPLFAGVNYTYKANDMISLFGDFGIGPDFMKITRTKVQAEDNEVILTYKTSTQFALKVGGGIMLNDKFFVSMHYNGFGEHEIEGEMEYNGNSSDLADSEIRVYLVTLTFGIKL